VFSGARTVEGKRDILGEPLELVRCVACSLTFQPKRFSEEQLANWYEYMGHNEANSVVSPLIHLRLASQVLQLASFRRNGRLLEIGCGGGPFLRAARDHGWEVYGTEISESCVALLRPWIGERLHQGSLEGAPWPTQHFDVVVMMEVIEHLEDPANVCRQARALLRPGGALYITTPNFRGVSARVFGDGWRTVADEHLQYYDVSSLTLLLERCGFRVERALFTNVDVPPFVHRLRAALRVAGKSGTRSIESNDSRATPRSGSRARLANEMVSLANSALSITRLGDTLKMFATAS
jgi:2-polyprenyl-3-methyl-5-hydroxy-6-metoxy-1,4-benzoquinol methylase